MDLHAGSSSLVRAGGRASHRGRLPSVETTPGRMIPAVLFAGFFVMLLIGTPIGVALGLAGTLAVYLADLGILSVPTNAYTGIAKYPLLAVPMFVLAGAIFDRSGVALRLVRFATAIV